MLLSCHPTQEVTNAGWPSPFRAPGVSSAKHHRFPLPRELEVACRAEHLCGFTDTSGSPPHTSLFPWGLRKGRDRSLAHFGHPAGFWAWGHVVEATPEWGVREGCVRKLLGTAPGGMWWPHWLCEGSSPKWATCGRWCWASAAPPHIWNPDGLSCLPEPAFGQIASQKFQFQGSHGRKRARLLAS